MWHNARLLNLAANLLFIFAAGVLLFAALGWLSQRPFFALRQIQVEALDPTGLRHVNLPSIRASALVYNGVPLNGSFFNVNLDQVRLAFETVPWVRHASVRRVWPNRLLVQLEEHRALATWPDGRLVNTWGELFAANLAEAEDDGVLREFSGPAGSEKQVTQRYVAFSNWLQPLQRTPQRVALSERNAWKIVLDNGTAIELGREQTATTLEERMQRYVAAVPQIEGTAQGTLARKLDYVDLRYPNGFAVRASGLRVMSEEEAKRKESTQARLKQ